MNEAHIGMAEARAQLPGLLGRVPFGGERIVLTKHGKPAAVLVSMNDLQRLRDATPVETQATSVEPAVELVETAATRSQVWRALTDPRERVLWWSEVDFDPQPGGRFGLLWSDAAGVPQRLLGTVAEFTDQHAFEVRWRSGDVTAVRLQDGPNGGTDVVVTHIGGAPPPGWQLDPRALLRQLEAH
ncbi:MAG: type II toxin-antitoxin system prevent-host-death family antitoxin [Mycobacteriaceae bacterium]